MRYCKPLELFGLVWATATCVSAGALAQRAATSKACNRDNCLRAVVASSVSRGPSTGLRDCSSFQSANPSTTTVAVVTTTTTTTTTVTDSTVTVTQTGLTTVMPTETQVVTVPTVVSTNSLTLTLSTPTVVAITTTDLVVVTPPPARRAASPSGQVPAYASACSGKARYSSACSCNGVSAQTVTAGRSTSTVTTTATATTTGTVTVTQVSTLTSPVTVTATSLIPTTVDLTAATVEVPVVSTTLVTVDVTSTAVPEPPAGVCPKGLFRLQITSVGYFLGYYIAYDGGAIYASEESNTCFGIDELGRVFTNTDGAPTNGRWRYNADLNSSDFIRLDDDYGGSSSFTSLVCNTAAAVDGVTLGSFNCPSDGRGGSTTGRRFAICFGVYLEFDLSFGGRCLLVDLAAVN